MEEQKQLIESLFEKGEHFGKTTLELWKLKALDKSADVASSFISWLIIILVALLFFLTLNIGFGFWLGELLGKEYLGFFVVAGFYALLGLIMAIFRNRLVKKPVSNSIINQVLKD